MSTEVKKLLKMINENFGHPFLKKGFVRAEDNEDKTFTLTIGRRSVTFNKNYRTIASGTVVSGNVIHEDDCEVKK